VIRNPQGCHLFQSDLWAHSVKFGIGAMAGLSVGSYSPESPGMSPFTVGPLGLFFESNLVGVLVGLSVGSYSPESPGMSPFIVGSLRPFSDSNLVGA
jgi:hypothetical protein